MDTKILNSPVGLAGLGQKAPPWLKIAGFVQRRPGKNSIYKEPFNLLFCLARKTHPFTA